MFKKAYIPRTLTEVSHYERDVDLMRTQEEELAISGQNDNVRTPNSALRAKLLEEREDHGHDDNGVLCRSGSVPDADRAEEGSLRSSDGTSPFSLLLA